MRGTFEPLRWEHLTIDEKKKILESHMFLQEKRDHSMQEFVLTSALTQVKVGRIIFPII